MRTFTKANPYTLPSLNKGLSLIRDLAPHTLPSLDKGLSQSVLYVQAPRGYRCGCFDAVAVASSSLVTSELHSSHAALLGLILVLCLGTKPPVAIGVVVSDDLSLLSS